MSMTWEQILSTIRTAIYGKEVREGIAQGMEQVKNFRDEAAASAASAAAALPINTALDTAGKAADAKAVGDAIPRPYTAGLSELDLDLPANCVVYRMGDDMQDLLGPNFTWTLSADLAYVLKKIGVTSNNSHHRYELSVLGGPILWTGYSTTGATSVQWFRVTDSTLSVTGLAADAKAVGDVKEAVEVVEEAVPVNLAWGVTFDDGHQINRSSGSAPEMASYSATSYVEVGGHEEIIYTRICDNFPMETPETGMAFYDANKNYISGAPCGKARVANTQLYRLAVPENAVFARFTFWRTENQKTHFAVYDAEQYDYSRVELDLSAAMQMIDANLDAPIGRGYEMEADPFWSTSRCIYTGGPVGSGYESVQVGDLLVADSTLKASNLIPVRGKNQLFVKMPRTVLSTPPSWGLCFYDENEHALKINGTNGLFGRSSDNPIYVSWVEVFVPEKAAFFRTTYWSDSYIEAHDIEAFSYYFTPGDWRDSAITCDMPANRGILNAVRRARQLTDLRWEPRVDVPRYSLENGAYSGQSDKHFLDWFEAGTEYVGAPYSGSGRPDGWSYGQIDPNCDAGQWGYYMFFLGLEVDFETFITASRYPNSIFGTRENREVYNYDSSIYGTVCTALLSYAVGLNSPIYPIPTFMSYYAKNYFYSLGTVPTVDASIIRIGDVLHNTAHVGIITDILRDKDGNITAIEFSEATTAGNPSSGAPVGGRLGGICRRKLWTLDEFRFWFQRYTMYRCLILTDLSYQASPYVDTGKELNRLPPIDLPCIPYLGNKARYKTGHILNSKILIGATGWTTLVVQKDGAEYGTYPINGRDEIEVGFSSVGAYTAYLTDDSNNVSFPCEWTVEEFTS